MESSIAVFLTRQFACEQLPTSLPTSSRVTSLCQGPHCLAGGPPSGGWRCCGRLRPRSRGTGCADIVATRAAAAPGAAALPLGAASSLELGGPWQWGSVEHAGAMGAGPVARPPWLLVRGRSASWWSVRLRWRRRWQSALPCLRWRPTIQARALQAYGQS